VRRPCARARSSEIPVARGKDAVLARTAATPAWSDGVDDVPRRQPVTARDLRLPRLAAAEGGAFRKQFRTGRAMDRAVHPTAPSSVSFAADDRIDSRRVMSPCRMEMRSKAKVFTDVKPLMDTDAH